MNKKFQLITSILIILLIALLIWIFISYYKESSQPIEPVYDNTPIENFENTSNTKIIPDNLSETGNDNLVIGNSENIDKNSEENQSIQNDEKQNESNNIQTTSDNGIVMTSDGTTSNAEKQKILTEIDNALNELLVVVDSVKTIDEEILDLDTRNEVQP